MSYGILTLYDAFFQKDLHSVRHWQHLSRLQFGAKAQIYKLSSSRFIRHYWGNHIHFLFLHLLICLNSVGSLVSLHAKCNNSRRNLYVLWKNTTKLNLPLGHRLNVKRKLSWLHVIYAFHTSMEQVATLTCNNAPILECGEPLSQIWGHLNVVALKKTYYQGEPWQCSMRSAFYWFAEFCHSQRLSHFAASFIVTRAEGSIAKSCKNNILDN